MVGFGSRDSPPIQSALGKQQQLEIGTRGEEKSNNQLSIRKVSCILFYIRIAKERGKAVGVTKAQNFVCRYGFIFKKAKS